MISAKIVADSKNEFGNRITTMEVVMPRFILAEFNTHRMFSRNSASSRAIPFEKMLKMVEETPFIPIAWQKDHKGMQGTEYLDEKTLGLVFDCQATDYVTTTIKGLWLEARDAAIEMARQLSKSEVTKQLCNRLLEPFMFHKVLVTATEWENFFALRCPKYYHYVGKSSEIRYRSRKDALKHWESIKDDLSEYDKIKDWAAIDWLSKNEGQAEIHMMELAECMWDAMNESTPNELKSGEWHIPFGEGISFDVAKWEGVEPIKELWGKDMTPHLLKVATAKAAGISYTTIGEDGKETPYVKLVARTNKLAIDGHWSCFEHCAQAMGNRQAGFVGGEDQGVKAWSGNFKGFTQYRKTFDNENIITK